MEIGTIIVFISSFLLGLFIYILYGLYRKIKRSSYDIKCIKEDLEELNTDIEMLQKSIDRRMKILATELELVEMRKHNNVNN